MEESGRKQTMGEAVGTIFFLFLLLIFLIYKFAYNKNVIVNESAQQKPVVQSREEILSNIKSESGSDLYTSYIDKVLDSKKNSSALDTQVLSDNFKSDLQGKIVVPETAIDLANISEKYSRVDYLNL